MDRFLRNSLEMSWMAEKGECPFSLPRLPEERSWQIYGDGVHEHVLQRLEEFYIAFIREMIEYNAFVRDGDADIWNGINNEYYEQCFLEDIQNKWYMKNLRNLKDIPASGIRWYVCGNLDGEQLCL